MEARRRAWSPEEKGEESRENPEALYAMLTARKSQIRERKKFPRLVIHSAASCACIRAGAHELLLLRVPVLYQSAEFLVLLLERETSLASHAGNPKLPLALPPSWLYNSTPAPFGFPRHRQIVDLPRDRDHRYVDTSIRTASARASTKVPRDAERKPRRADVAIKYRYR